MSLRYLLALLPFILLVVCPLAGPVDSGVDLSQTRTGDILASEISGGVPALYRPYAVLTMRVSSIPSRAIEISNTLNSSGAISRVVYLDEVSSDGLPLTLSSAIVLDPSIGSEQGQAIPVDILSVLIRIDRPVVAVGRSAWVLHRLRGTGPPTDTCLVDPMLSVADDFQVSTILSYPFSVSLGSQLTTETTVAVPRDTPYSEMSVLVNVTGVSASSLIAPLRYDSWPLELFLFGPEDPTCWTESGKSLFLNTLAFAASLGETSTAYVLSECQSGDNETLGGGLRYFHEPTLDAAYWIAGSMYLILNAEEWGLWCTRYSSTITGLLSTLLVDLGPQSAFKNTPFDSQPGIIPTAMGLWLASVMSLPGFDTQELTSYLVSSQSGGWGNSVSTTYYVIAALHASGALAQCDVDGAISWLRSCVITGARTSDPNLWGGVSSNPTTLNPQNDHAMFYLLSLRLLGTSHNDPAKLSQWIRTQTAVGDGSYLNSPSMQSTVVRGTASALAALQIMNTLTYDERTAGVTWLRGAQSPSGGFGQVAYPGDIQSKTVESGMVAIALEEMSLTQGEIATGIVSFAHLCSSPMGFERTEPLPTLLWSSILGRAARAAHALGGMDAQSLRDYLLVLTKLSMYPSWQNITVLPAPEYMPDQYGIRSVWSQWLGVSLAYSLGITLPEPVLGSVIQYLSSAQSPSGLYRPTNIGGVPSIQHTVAAVEALYRLGSLNTIVYRTELEASLLSVYSGGSWSTDGWTLRPFTGNQEVIDYLSTRAALRLGLVTPTIAAEIAGVLAARIQYDRLWALASDVATLHLLVSHGLIDPSMLDAVNRTRVMTELEHLRSTGWLSADPMWQPVYTADVLEMICRLGLRLQLYDRGGSSLTIGAPPQVTLGESLRIDVTIGSSTASHAVLVGVAGTWLRFEDVHDGDTLLVRLTESVETLGEQRVWVVVWDWGKSRAHSATTVVVLGVLVGDLALDETVILEGDTIAGTVNWSFPLGGDTGASQVTIKVQSLRVYREYSYVASSPLPFSIESSGLAPDSYQLTAIIHVPGCTDLVLAESLVVLECHRTYIIAPAQLSATVGTSVALPFSLLYLDNGSSIPFQLVWLEISIDGQTLLSDSVVTSMDGGVFYWVPTARGNYTYSLRFVRNGTLESSLYRGSVLVSESTNLTLSAPGIADQYSSVNVTAALRTDGGVQLAGLLVNYRVLSPLQEEIMTGSATTDDRGMIVLNINMSLNGPYRVYVWYDGGLFLLPSDASCVIVSWSASNLRLVAAPADGLVGEPLHGQVQLVDSSGMPVSGVPVRFVIILLPSTTVVEVADITDSTGMARLVWESPLVGEFRVECIYGGDLSRGASFASWNVCVRIPVHLTVNTHTLHVGTLQDIVIAVTDHLGQPVNGLSVYVTILDAHNTTVLSAVVTSQNGTASLMWCPVARGTYGLIVTTLRQSYFEGAECVSPVTVLERATVSVYWNPSELRAVQTHRLSVLVVDLSGRGISGLTINVTVVLAGQIVLKALMVTDDSGIVRADILLSQPGHITVSFSFSPQSFIDGQSGQSEDSVLGLTSTSTNLLGLPVRQGAPVGIVVSVGDWRGYPLAGGLVRLTIRSYAGVVLHVSERSTGEDGTCGFSYVFQNVGDFYVLIEFMGREWDAPSSASLIQRVQVTPTLHILHDVSCVLGNAAEFVIAVADAYGVYVAGRPLVLTITSEGNVVFQTIVNSSNVPVSVRWYPSSRGVFQVNLVHVESAYYLSNSVSTSISVLEIVSGALSLSTTQIPISGSVVLSYTLNASNPSGVPIRFEILDYNLLPVWSRIVLTAENGVATTSCVVDMIAGVLIVQATPLPDALVLGGGCQCQLVVMTECVLDLSTVPSPALRHEDVNVSLICQDELGLPIAQITVIVTVIDPYGNTVRLGPISNSISVVVRNGAGSFKFTPGLTGLYRVYIQSSGAAYVYPFNTDRYLVVYTQTVLSVENFTSLLVTGDTAYSAVSLHTSDGTPMTGMPIGIVATGPGGTVVGPFSLVTNDSGVIQWSFVPTPEGIWTVTFRFLGMGVYLPSDAQVVISVCYGTRIYLNYSPQQDIVTSLTPLVVSVLLTDSGGTPLEGRTITYCVYHSVLGLVDSASFIQLGPSPETIEIYFGRMGNYTVVFLFSGTTHYFRSSAAIDVFVRGLVSIQVDLPQTLDRSEHREASLVLLDETGQPLDPQLLEVQLVLRRGSQIIPIHDRLSVSSRSVSLDMFGLEPGDYELSVSVTGTPLRTGAAQSFPFSVTTVSRFQTSVLACPGLVGNSHRIVFLLLDSIDSRLDGIVRVSLFDPQGREILGSPLTTVTEINVVNGTFEISWIPLSIGYYRLVMVYTGQDRIQSSEIEMTFLARYESTLQVSSPDRIRYMDPARMYIQLRGGTGTIPNGPLKIVLRVDGVLLDIIDVSVNMAGSYQLDLKGLPAGLLNVTVLYEGSSAYAPCRLTRFIWVEPIVQVRVIGGLQHTVRANVTLSVESAVLGASSSWSGTLSVRVTGSDGELLSRVCTIGPTHTLVLWFVPMAEGNYSLEVCLSDVPVLNSSRSAFVITVVSLTIYEPMVESAPSLAGGSLALAGVGLLVRKRLRLLLRFLPDEWVEEAASPGTSV